MAANVFALFSLRSLYFVLQGMMDKFIYLKTGTGIHQGVYWHQDAAGGKRYWSLGVLITTMTVSGIAAINENKSEIEQIN